MGVDHLMRKKPQVAGIVKGWEEMVDVFRKGKFELLALTETKLKGNLEVSGCGVNGITAGIQEMDRPREGVAVLLNEAWHSVMIDFGCASSSILWINFRF